VEKLPNAFMLYVQVFEKQRFSEYEKKWIKINIILIVTLVALIWMHPIGCNSFLNAQKKKLFRRYKIGFSGID